MITPSICNQAEISEEMFSLLMSSLQYLTEISVIIPTNLVPILTANTNAQKIAINTSPSSTPAIQTPLFNFRSTLQILELYNTSLLEVDCIAISSSNIKELYMVRCTFIDDEYTNIANMTQLRVLSLKHVSFPTTRTCPFHIFLCGSLISLEKFEYTHSEKYFCLPKGLVVNLPKLTSFKTNSPTEIDLQKLLQNAKVATLDLSDEFMLNFEFL